VALISDGVLDGVQEFKARSKAWSSVLVAFLVTVMKGGWS
jgi:hypothetical protein